MTIRNYIGRDGTPACQGVKRIGAQRVKRCVCTHRQGCRHMNSADPPPLPAGRKPKRVKGCCTSTAATAAIAVVRKRHSCPARVFGPDRVRSGAQRNPSQAAKQLAMLPQPEHQQGQGSGSSCHSASRLMQCTAWQPGPLSQLAQAECSATSPPARPRTHPPANFACVVGMLPRTQTQANCARKPAPEGMVGLPKAEASGGVPAQRTPKRGPAEAGCAAGSVPVHAPEQQRGRQQQQLRQEPVRLAWEGRRGGGHAAALPRTRARAAAPTPLMPGPPWHGAAPCGTAPAPPCSRCLAPGRWAAARSCRSAGSLRWQRRCRRCLPRLQARLRKLVTTRGRGRARRLPPCAQARPWPPPRCRGGTGSAPTCPACSSLWTTAAAPRWPWR